MTSTTIDDAPSTRALHAGAAELPQRRVRRALVAPDQGPQAHRHPLSVLRHPLLRRRRHLRRFSCASSCSRPKATCSPRDTYNKLFTLHGIVMIFFFLIPAIPAVLGNFILPIMLGAKDLAFPQAQPAQLVPLHHRRHVRRHRHHHRRRRHRLDVLHALLDAVLEHARLRHDAAAPSSPASPRSSPASTSSSPSTACARRG